MTHASMRPSIVALAVAAALSAGFSAADALAKGGRPMSLIDIAELSRLADPQLSPDGRFVVYSLSHADWKLGRAVFQLWRQEVGGGAPLQLTFTPTGMIPGSTRWSPDGKSILFMRDGQFVLMPAEGGEARPLTRHATSVSLPTWSPDGSAVYFLATDARSGEERDREQRRDDVYAFEETYKQRHLWKVTVSTSGEQAITSGDWSVINYRLSRDARHLAIERAPSPLNDDADRIEVWTIDADGANARQLTTNRVHEIDPELSPDNSRLLFIASGNARLDGDAHYNQNLFVMPASGGAPTALLPDLPYEVDRATWTPDGRSILAVFNMGVQNQIALVNVAARTYQLLTEGQHSIPVAPAPAWYVEPRAGKIVFMLDQPDRYGDVWTMPMAGGTPTRITGVYDTLASTFDLPREERFEWKGADGAAVDGVLFYPTDYQAGQRYPLVVQMHGGPMESDKFGSGAGLLLNYFPVLTGKGYLVLRPNYRGSSGYGNAAYRDVVGHYFHNMQLDILAAVDALIARGLADPERMVLMGWSAGGHLTNKLITMTDRFKAASAGASASNWISLYAQTDARYLRTPWFGGTPWQGGPVAELYWNESPLKDAAKVKTPTLFFVGENDGRVPLAQSLEMWRALKANGVPTRLMVAPREGHQWVELRHQIAKANAELAWFEQYARGRAYTPEKTP